ncbi:MAG: DUF3307 domain-containing protein [Gemmatimonadota bacterium]
MESRQADPAVTSEAALLLAALFFAHFVGDYTPLANARMQDAKAVGTPVGPIAGHALIHALLATVAVVMVARPGLGPVAIAAAVVFGTHLAIDVLRGRMGARQPELSNPERQAFWTALGFDQLLHGLVLIGVAWLVLRPAG